MQPSEETAAMLFWSLLAPGQITMQKVDGWQSPAEPPASIPPDLVASNLHPHTGHDHNFHIFRDTTRTTACSPQSASPEFRLHRLTSARVEVDARENQERAGQQCNKTARSSRAYHGAGESSGKGS